MTMHPVRDIGRAIDDYLGELARKGRTPETLRSYRRILNGLADSLPGELSLQEITTSHCRRYLNRWSTASPSTGALYVSCLRGFFAFFAKEEAIAENPMARVERPRRPRPEDLDVVTITSDEAMRLFAACETWQEFLCIAVLLFLGVRRRAASSARLRDVDFAKGTIRFREKGRKVIVKPIPDQLLMILELAREENVWAGPNDYLIPSRRPPKQSERAHKVIYETVRKVAGRAGVRSHVHALRGAFAVQFLETHAWNVDALKHLLGHSRVESTYVYLRRANKFRSMEAVRDLSWGSVLPPRPEVPPAGFEPAFQESPVVEPNSANPAGSLQDPLRAKLDELSRGARKRARS